MVTKNEIEKPLSIDEAFVDLIEKVNDVREKLEKCKNGVFSRISSQSPISLNHLELTYTPKIFAKTNKKMRGKSWLSPV